VENLAHSASFHSWENNAPSKRGIKHLKLWLVDQPGRGAPEIAVRRLLDRLGDLQGTLAEIVGRV
jgi:hypothetical protein